MNALAAEKLSIDAFLEWENAQPERHEFYRGEVFAMVGARRVHLDIAGNLFGALKAHLKGTPCRAYMEGAKLQTSNDAIFYPDVFVTCDPADLKTEMVFRKPSLVTEVLSESTASYDRGLKFAAYRQIDTLREYVLIDPDTRRVEVFRRNERGNFELIDQTGAPDLVLDSVGLRLPTAELFEGVDSPEA